MRNLAKFLIKFRIAIAIAFIALAAVFAVAILHVNVNKDMTQYLPADMQVKHGMDVMADQFGESTPVRIMVKDVAKDDRQALSTELGKLDYVSSIEYEEDSPLYNKDEYVLYSCQVEGNSYTSTAQIGHDSLTAALDSRGYEYWVAADIGNTANTLGLVYFFGIIMAMIILFVLASSWIEPVLVLITIVIAVAINMGTNVFFPSVSDTTASIGGILQMVLSMDYLIMLMNRYRAERDHNPPQLSMENALTDGVTAIASSSVTTVVGLLCLCFMSFTIGADLGIVLAKGVAISLVCVFAVQPALVLACDNVLMTTAKPFPKPKMKALTAFAYKLRYPLLILFVVLFAVGYSLRGVTNIGFIIQNNTPGTEQVNETFAPREQVVVLFPNEAAAEAAPLEDAYKQDPRVQRVNSYTTTVGEQFTVAQLSDKMGIDQPVVSMLFSYYNSNGDAGSVPKDAFVSYLRNQAPSDLGAAMGDGAADTFAQLADLIDAAPQGTYTPAGLVEAVGKHSLTEDTVRLLYFAYHGANDADPSWTLSIDQLTEMLTGTVMNDPSFDTVFDAKTKKALTDARKQIAHGAESMRGPDYSRFVLEVPYEATSAEMDAFLTEVRQACAEGFTTNDWYLVGSGVMVQEMQASFPKEFSTISIITIVAILLIVLIAFRSAAVPVVLTAIIQCAFCWDMILNYALGNEIYYLALLVLQAILMGATIDYAILFTSNYRESRETLGVRDAIGDAYRRSFRTIFMSGGILVVVTGVLGQMAEGITGKICLVISEGATIAVILVMVVLPGVLAALDKLVVSRKKAYKE